MLRLDPLRKLPVRAMQETWGAYEVTLVPCSSCSARICLTSRLCPSCCSETTRAEHHDVAAVLHRSAERCGETPASVLWKVWVGWKLHRLVPEGHASPLLHSPNASQTGSTACRIASVMSCWLTLMQDRQRSAGHRGTCTRSSIGERRRRLLNRKLNENWTIYHAGGICQE